MFQNSEKVSIATKERGYKQTVRGGVTLEKTAFPHQSLYRRKGGQLGDHGSSHTEINLTDFIILFYKNPRQYGLTGSSTVFISAGLYYAGL